MTAALKVGEAFVWDDLFGIHTAWVVCLLRVGAWLGWIAYAVSKV